MSANAQTNFSADFEATAELRGLDMKLFTESLLHYASACGDQPEIPIIRFIERPARLPPWSGSLSRRSSRCCRRFESGRAYQPFQYLHHRVLCRFEQCRFDQDFVRRREVGSGVFDDPGSEAEACLLKTCCAKADTTCLCRSNVVSCPVPHRVGPVVSGLLAEPVVSDLAGAGLWWSSHDFTDCLFRYSTN